MVAIVYFANVYDDSEVFLHKCVFDELASGKMKVVI